MKLISNPIGRIAIAVGVLIFACMAYNIDAITGQWKFKRLCKEEGGPRFYAPVEKGEGWEVEGLNTDYRWPFSFEHVAFVRYKNNQGLIRDVYAGKYIAADERLYEFLPIDERNIVRYRLEYSRGFMEGDDRFSKSELKVIDLKSKNIVASFTKFGYRWTSPDRVILAAPTAVQCWAEQSAASKFNKDLFDFRERK